MSHIGAKDLMLEIALGHVPGHYGVNKFGRCPNGAQTTPTDVWDRANAAADQQIWLAPTAARIHNIVSSAAADTSAGAGAKTIRVYGLPDWDTEETFEDIIMAGTTPVPTAAYVIIHRMKVLTKGASGPNVGTITATAAVDGTITAQINPDQGQTQMAIYGIPSIQTACMMAYYGSLHDTATPATAGRAELVLLANPEPDVELLTYLVKHTQGIQSDGTSYLPHQFRPYNCFIGPVIIKMQTVGSAADLDLSAGFSLILVDH